MLENAIKTLIFQNKAIITTQKKTVVESLAKSPSNHVEELVFDNGKFMR